MVLDQFDNLTSQDPEGIDGCFWGDLHQGATRAKASRWRRFWNGSYTRVRVRDDMTKEQIHDKVEKNSQVKSFFVHRGGPQNGPHDGSDNSAVSTTSWFFPHNSLLQGTPFRAGRRTRYYFFWT